MFLVDLDEVKKQYSFLERLIDCSTSSRVYLCEVDKEIYSLRPCNLRDGRRTVSHHENWSLYVVRRTQKNLELVNMTMGEEYISPARNWTAGPDPAADDEDYIHEGETVRNALSRCNLDDVEYVVLHDIASRDYQFNKIFIGRFLPL